MSALDRYLLFAGASARARMCRPVRNGYLAAAVHVLATHSFAHAPRAGAETGLVTA